jgi:transcriptional regulator with XRE-family HTH domain
MAESKRKTDPLQDSVRALIFKKRNLLGLSRDQLGYLTGYDQSSIRKIENGDRNPSLAATFNLFGALGLRPSTVMKRIEKDVGFEIMPRTRIQEILDAERPPRRPKKYRGR